MNTLILKGSPRYTLYFVLGLMFAFLINASLTRAQEDIAIVDAVIPVEEAEVVIVEDTEEGTTDGAVVVSDDAVASEEVSDDTPSDTTTETEVVPDEPSGPTEEGELIFDFFDWIGGDTAETTTDSGMPTEPESPVEEQATGDTPETPVTENTSSTPELTTDKAEYAPGETATIFGKFFAPVKTFVLRIFAGSLLNEEEVYFEDTVVVESNEVGAFNLDYQLSDIFAPLYRIFAEDEAGEVVAETSFIDPLKTDFSQCSNDNPTDGSCNWIGSIIQQSNSIYYEGMTVPQRLFFTDAKVVNGNHTITFTYQYTKAGIHAYDFLTTVNPNLGIAQGNAAYIPGTPVLNPCANLGGAAAECNALNPTGVVPQQIVIPNDPFDSKDAVPSGQTAKENAYEALTGMDRYISAYVNGGTATFGAVTLTHDPVGANSDTTDSDVTVTIPFTTSGCTNGDGCDILLYFGGHLAVTGDGNAESWGPGLGSSQISGGPYHIKSVQFDGTGGSQDNQIKGADILLPPEAPEGNIIVEKQTLPNGDQQSFTFNPSWSDQDFVLTDGQQNDSGALVPGTYSVTEAVPTGWTQTSAICTSSLGGTESVGAIELDDTETVTCVFTNTKLGSLTLVKNTIGGNDTFDFDATGGGLPADIDLTTVGGTASQTFTNLSTTNSYTLLENEPQGWVETSAICDNGETVDSINIDPGQTVTCTFTNTKNTTLTLLKEVVNDNGGTALDTAWTLEADGPTDISGIEGSLAVTSAVVTPGSYTLSESGGPSGYSGSQYSCVKNGGQAVVSNSLTLAAGDNAVCTVTNNDTAPILHLRKIVINDNGGKATVGDFTLTANGTGSNDISGTSPVDSGVGLDADTFALSETNVAGYTASDWVCVGGTQNGASVTLGIGQEATCTITNNDQQAQITVIKTVINNNGGGAQPNDFALTLEGNAVTSGVAVPVNPGTYTAGETPVAGYSFVGYTGDCDLNGDVTVALGESKTCTLTNDDQPGHLIVNKVTNPASDTTTQFSITASGGTIITPAATQSIVGGGEVDYTVHAGTYNVSEADLPGWDETANTCVDVVIANGETKECTITNVKRGSITIVKDVIGNPDPTDFTFNNNFGNGNPASFLLDEDENGTLPSSRSFEVLPGTYAVSEVALPGWQSPETTSCDQGETVDSIDVAPGESVTCTFVNEELAKIVLVKNTIGGNGDFSFIMTGEGLPANTMLTTVGGTDSETFESLDQDNNYSITETVPEGWDLTSASCTGSNTPASITPDAGETVTCTFTNTKRGQIIVEKETLPDGDGQSFVFTASYDQGGFSLKDGESDTSALLVPGTYSVAETVPAGWELNSATCDDTSAPSAINLAAGETVTCTFENEKSGTIIIEKVAIGGNGTFDYTSGTLGDATFEITTTEGVGDITFSNLDVDTVYDVLETAETGWDMNSAVCDSGETIDSINLEPGETVTCTFTNTKRGEIIVDKVTNPSGDPQSFDFTTTAGSNFALTDAATPHSTGAIVPGVYSVTETVPPGWDLESAVCSDESPVGAINVGPGETVTCTFTNEKDAYIIVKKETLPDGDLASFVFTADYDGDGFSLSDGQQNDSGDLDPGTYDIAETVPTGWELTDTTCESSDDDEETAGAIDLQAGETVTCTFTNTKDGRIEIEKQTFPDATTIPFEFMGEIVTVLKDGESAGKGAKPGTYVVSEDLIPGWTLADIACGLDQNSVGDEAEKTATFDVDPGETVRCIFTNVKDPFIRIGESAVNEVGDPHTFTILVGQDVNGEAEGGVVAVVGVNPVVTIMPEGATIVEDTCATDGTDADGECTITINSTEANEFTAHAALTITIGGVEYTIETDGEGENSDVATKAYIDASISLTPQTGINEVGDKHEIIATVTLHTGGADVPVENELVTFTMTTGTAQFDGGNTCVTQSDGTCSIFIVDTEAGQNSVDASVSITASGLELERSTAANFGPIGSDEAEKTYVDARISIDPQEATNNVGEPHVFTVFVEENDGEGWDAAADEDVTFTLLNSSADAIFVGDNFCTTSATGTCSITINSLTPGSVDVHAASDVEVLELPLTRETDGVGDNSGDGTKIYVAGKIVVKKLTNPAESPVEFTFDPSWTTDFELTDGETETSDWLPLATYSVTEMVPEGWDLVSATCDNGDVPTSTITLDTDAEIVTCTFTNRERGSLEIAKAIDIGDYALDVNTSFDIEVTGPSYPTGTTLTFTVTDGVVSDPQTLSNLIPGEYTVEEDDDANLGWTVTGEGPVTVDPGEDETAIITNTLKEPNTTISVTADTYETLPGGNVVLTIADTNDGEAPLANNTVEITYGTTTLILDMDDPEFVGGDTNGNDLMDPGETWTWVVSLTINANITITVEGHGVDPLGNDISPDTGYESELGSIEIRVIGTTRTIGFWQTHTTFTSYVFALPSMQKFVGVNVPVGANTHKGIITNILALGQSQLFGGFYAPIAKTTSGGKRTPIDQARIQMLQQLLAAKLNCAAFGCSNTVKTLITNADAAYAAGANKGTIISLAGQLDSFNNSGDAFAIPAGLPPTGNATPKDSKNYANLSFWNNP